MIKKLLGVFLTLVAVATTVNSVNAATLTTDGGTAKVPVKYSVNTTAFEIIIPAVIMPGLEESSFSVGAALMNIRPDQCVEVSLISGCNDKGQIVLVRQNVEDGKIPSTIATSLSVNGTKLGAGNMVVARFEDGKTSTVNKLGAVSMSALNITKDTEPGDYEATVEFKVSLRNK